MRFFGAYIKSVFLFKPLTFGEQAMLLYEKRPSQSGPKGSEEIFVRVSYDYPGSQIDIPFLSK